jgi:hypothetical protein
MPIGRFKPAPKAGIRKLSCALVRECLFRDPVASMTSSRRDPLDEPLRQRVADEVASFDAAFSAAIKNQTAQTLEELARAANRLMRAVARVLIEAKRRQTKH